MHTLYICSKSLLVNFLIEQASELMESGLIMPNVKQCMHLVNRAWNKVSDNSTFNCWEKCRTLSNFERRKEVD